MVRKTTPAKSTTKTVTKTSDPVQTPEIVETPDVVTGPKVMGKRELIDLVVTASGIKKKAAKPVVEAMLKELGDALSRGETLNLQPFGKGIVKNRKDLENAEIVEIRLRRSKLALKAAETRADGGDDEGPRDPLAEAAE